MTREQFKKELSIFSKILWRESGGKIIITNPSDGDGPVFLVGKGKIPSGVEFENSGSVHFITTEISEGTVFRNSGSVSIIQKEIPEGVVFANDGSVSIRETTYIHGGVKFENLEHIIFQDEFPKMAPGVEIKNKGMLISDNPKGDLTNPLYKIEGISSQRVMNFMIGEGLLDRK